MRETTSMGRDTLHYSWGLIYVICGMSLGGVMAAAHYDVHYLTPEHVLLVGLVLSLVYGMIHKLWLIVTQPIDSHPSVICLLHHIRQAGMMTMFTALLLAYGNVFLDVRTEPVHAAAALTVLLGAMSLLYQLRSTPAHG